MADQDAIIVATHSPSNYIQPVARAHVFAALEVSPFSSRAEPSANSLPVLSGHVLNLQNMKKVGDEASEISANIAFVL
jgi:hypothetical protein